MANHLMIDLETLDTRPTAVVFQVGLIAFKDVLHDKPMAFEEPPLENLILGEKLLHVDILSQVIRGRTIDPETVAWWNQQKPESWMRHPEETVLEHDVFAAISEMMGHHGIGDVWSNSPSFDAVLMRSLGDDMKKRGIQFHEFPSFRSDMDMRTLKALLLRKGMGLPKKETTHNALKDCRDQVELVVMMLRRMRDMSHVLDMYEKGELTPTK